MLNSLIDIKSLDFSKKWVDYLYNTNKKIVNYERINSLKNINTKHAYNYVIKTLEILNEEKDNYEKKIVYYVEETLKWSEVSKGGTREKRKEWKDKKINFFVHNIGSYEIYLLDNEKYDNVVSILIKTHGLIGQAIRGETTLDKNKELYDLIKNNEITKEELRKVLVLLNKCVVGAVSFDLYNNIKDKINYYIDLIVDGKFDEENNIIERLSLLNGTFTKEEEEKTKEILNNDEISKRINELLSSVEIWFYEAALKDFSISEQIKLLLIIYNNLDKKSKYLTFEKIMQTIYFDYNGKKEVNIYKKRIVENYISLLTFDSILNNNISSNSHLIINVMKKGSTVIPYFKFSIQASKLIEFCEVAYVSDSLYNKAVFMLYDLFGFRRDNYDRFYNEINYLNTMNKSIKGKSIILDYIIGKDILDVGPGGGALMDLILENDSSLNVTGIDISTNVIDNLLRRKKEENKKWNIIKGDALNLLDYLNKESVDTVIYSSIIHELFSYIEYNGKKFNHEVIVKTLKSAYDILRKNGRIIIRDGIKTEPTDEYRIIEFKNIDDIKILDRYCNDFEGRKVTYQKIDDNKVKMLVNDAMEFLYTYTWGEDSYALEVKEQFGYYTPDEYLKVIKENLKGSKIITCKSFLQSGYEKYLLKKIAIYDEDMNVVKLPNSTCIIVIEKG